ncbi:hypothetical protein FSP39_013337 [Pinctada imbricata]|uniref:Uncharacterized protein n=1 Tax=Pinctada imbricata TaxID=66713 RepID=A0AA89BX22_PINIB|nr:hypothetical protein FSP39_013337 [Pinctada imbricata]
MMADWGILRNSTGKDFLSMCGHEISTIHHMMSDLDFSGGTVYSGHDSQVDENTFCTSDNVDHCITYLNQELLSLGFMSLSMEGMNRTTSLINRLYELLRLYQKHARVKEELENRLHRVTSQSDHYQNYVTRLKNDVEKVKREVCREQEKSRQLVVKQKSLSVKLKAEKDEVKRLQLVLRDRDAQYKHELKKKERESNKLKEKIHQLLADKTPNRRVGLDMAYSIQSSDGKRSTWKTTGSSKQEDMYQYLISNYEDKQRELLVENTELRDSIYRIQKDVDKALRVNADNTNNKNGVDRLGVPVSESDSDTEDGDDNDRTNQMFSQGYIQMPYDIIRESIETSLRGRCRKIKERKKSRRKLPSPKSTKSSPSKTPVTSKDLTDKQTEELNRINQQIEKYKDIIQQQEHLIKNFIHAQSEAEEGPSFLHDSQLLQEKEALTEQRRLFYTEKANFEKERRQLTEEAIRLGEQRRALESEKASVLMTQFLQISPMKQSDLSSTSPVKGDSARLLPSTPMFSPAPSLPPKTPTTAELMKFLGLTKDTHGSNRSTPLSHSKGRELQRSASTESLVTPNKSISEIDDINELSLDRDDQAVKKTLFRRRSSTGSNDDLGV